MHTSVPAFPATLMFPGHINVGDSPAGLHTTCMFKNCMIVRRQVWQVQLDFTICEVN